MKVAENVTFPTRHPGRFAIAATMMGELELSAPDEKQKRFATRLKPSESASLKKLAEAGLGDFAPIRAAIAAAVADRMRLARQFLESAKEYGIATERTQRRTVSACYYSQYHAARAVVLLHDEADRDDHKDLPERMEKIFPGKGISGVLKDTLDKRRAVDYDPYLNFDLSTAAGAAVPQAETFFSACQAYLGAAGVVI